MATGIVKWFNVAKKYGFIAPEDGSQGVFVRREEIEPGGFRALNEGDQVSYEVTRGLKGPQANDVKKL